MAVGYLTFKLHQAYDALPVEGASIEIYSEGNTLLHTLYSDENGESETISLDTPEEVLSLTPEEVIPYATYTARIYKNGFDNIVINGIKIFGGELTIQPVNMIPATGGINPLSRMEDTITYDIPQTTLLNETPRNLEVPPEGRSRILQMVIIPDYITVHLGRPDRYARNIKVKFTDYLKNVASHEIYPTWPQEALRANILCQISLVLNRIYTEWYPSQGYDFTITNSTAYDQCYVEGGNIFESVSLVVDSIFNQYVRRHGRTEPYYTEYCSGSTVTCNGLSQWGSVSLAQSGMSAYEILTYYYPNDIEIATCNNFMGITESYPGTALRLGSRGVDVQNMQIYLNRISRNYPLIPKISNPNGYFGEDTEAAVITFQQVFNLVPDGIIGKATWYRISYIYLAVTKLAELGAEAAESIGTQPPDVILREGDQGHNVKRLQYMLNYLGEFIPELPILSPDGIFSAKTKSAVTNFQLYAGLSPDGVVGPQTWQALYDTYYAFNGASEIPNPPPVPPTDIPTYPGFLLKEGTVGNEVRLMQGYLSKIADYYPAIPKITTDGHYGPRTTQAVRAFQHQFALSPDGIIGPATWKKIAEVYFGLDDSGSATYPGYILARGSTGEYVSMLQNYLNAITASYGLFPALSVDSIFGQKTEDAVKIFQSRFGLIPDGLVGPLTWNKIVDEYNKIRSNRNVIQGMSRALIGRMFFGRPF